MMTTEKMISHFGMSDALRQLGFHSVDLFPDGREEFELGRFFVLLPPRPIAVEEFEAKLAKIKSAIAEGLEGNVTTCEL
jgi:hypothetical protein